MHSHPRSSLACLLLSCFLALPVFAQRPQFNPQSDYAYDLAATDAAVVTIELEAGGFKWPAKLPPGETLLLEFALETTGSETPTVTASAGETAVHQVFEAGGKGRRFLDLSPLRTMASGATVSLAGNGAGWRRGPARLFVYRNRPLAGQRVLVLAPHPDDAEIGTFGLYRRTHADVITVTAGDAGGENFKKLFPESGEHYRVKGWIRTWDSISVPFYGGVMPGKARNLGYYDGVLQRMAAAPSEVSAPLAAKLDDPAFYRRLNVDVALRDRPFEGTWQGLVSDLLWELKRTKPSLIVAPHPLLDAHPDHQYTTIALIEALAKWRGECELYLYTNHAMENEAYPLGDRAAMSGLPASSRADFLFRRLYSHPLTVEEQKLKLIALEDMHDLREFDLRDGTPPAEEAMRRSWKDHDYYRRGPRPNELFFVLTKADAQRLRESFLAQKKAGPAGPATK